jgi:hypothetical protein
MKQNFALISLDIDILFRSLAIIAIIFLHAHAAVSQQSKGFHIIGGSTLLLLISGFNIARFQSKKLFEGLSLQIVVRFFHKIIIPYYLVVISYQIWKQQLDWHSLLLISNYYGRFGNFLDPYWFIELLLQIIIIFTSFFTIPIFRKTAEKSPLIVGLVLLFLTVLLRLSNLTDANQLGIRTADKLLCIYIFGWCVWFAKTPLQKAAMTALALTLFPYLYGVHSSYTIWLVLGCLAIVWQPKILMPKLFHTVIVSIGSSTFYIYLIHIIPLHIMAHIKHIQNIPAIIIAALLSGILVRKGLEKFKL